MLCEQFVYLYRTRTIFHLIISGLFHIFFKRFKKIKGVSGLALLKYTVPVSVSWEICHELEFPLLSYSTVISDLPNIYIFGKKSWKIQVKAGIQNFLHQTIFD